MAENSENSSNWSLIKFDGKPIEKLLDVVSSAVGTLYKPRAIRNEAEAEAKKMEIIANAEAKTNIIKLDNHFELLKRAKDRITIQEINRQVNLEEIIEKTIKLLPETVSEEEVAQDWRTRFFSKAQDISNEDMQEIWAKLLANEISQPNSISLRTIDILSNLSKSEAKKFHLLCSMSSGSNCVYKFQNKNDLAKYNLSYGDLMELKGAGLIHDSDKLIKKMKKLKEVAPNFDNPIADGFIITLGKGVYFFKKMNDNSPIELNLSQIAFTKAGEEICKVINFDLHSEYYNDWLNEKRQEGYQIEELISSSGQKEK